MEGLDAAIVVGGPAAVLVAADFAFEPIHEKSRPLTVYSQEEEKKKTDHLKKGKEAFLAYTLEMAYDLPQRISAQLDLPPKELSELQRNNLRWSDESCAGSHYRRGHRGSGRRQHFLRTGGTLQS